MSVFLFNLTFTIPNSSGFFDANPKQWFDVIQTWQQPNPGSQVTGLASPVITGANPLPTGSSLSCAPGDDIYLQVAPSSFVNTPPSTATLAVTFGRSEGNAAFASPFNGSAGPQTYFPFNNGSTSGPQVSQPFWLYYLGPAANFGFFGFIVNLLVQTPNGLVYFGVDPQMVVTS